MVTWDGTPTVARKLALAPFLPWQGLARLDRLRRSVRRGGCRYGCSHPRSDASRLPWRTNARYGGWGGHDYHDTDPGVTHRPIVFVHGNQRDACDWNAHADALRDRGVGGDSLWAITFGRGTPTHEEMGAQLEQFVRRVRTETGAARVNVVAHSLGVTGVRYWIDTYGRASWVDAVVALGGANHGLAAATACCTAGLTSGLYRNSDFLRTDYESHPDHPLRALNEDETPGETDYYTVRGSLDDLYWLNPDSPALDGATENVSLDVDHDGTRTDPRVLDLLWDWAVQPT